MGPENETRAPHRRSALHRATHAATVHAFVLRAGDAWSAHRGRPTDGVTPPNERMAKERTRRTPRTRAQAMSAPSTSPASSAPTESETATPAARPASPLRLASGEAVTVVHLASELLPYARTGGL